MNVRSSIRPIKSAVVCVSLVFFIGFLSLLYATETKWEWPRSTPEAQGLDSTRLTRLVEIIREGEEFPDLHSLLIVRNEYLVVEEYFGRYTADKLHTLQSVSKSFTSALIGIAIERGDIRSVEEKVLDFFPHMFDIKNMDSRKASMTLEDLLTMRSGTDYHEGLSGTPHNELNSLERGWDRFYLDRPMIRKPGSYFQYDSGGVILMSSMLKNRSGMHADAYAEKFLFRPLDISKCYWFKNREGHPHTGGGLNILPSDMAKFGLLYLNRGEWEGKQVVPVRWVDKSVQKHVDLIREYPGVIGYGYLWWILSPDPDGAGKELIYAAMGFRAQYIFVIPEHDMVVVITGGTKNSADQRKPIRFLYSHILPSIKR
ncbi:MAG: serine hydrolase [Candidatus Aminicenantes bacterium]